MGYVSRPLPASSNIMPLSGGSPTWGQPLLLHLVFPRSALGFFSPSLSSRLLTCCFGQAARACSTRTGVLLLHLRVQRAQIVTY